MKIVEKLEAFAISEKYTTSKVKYQLLTIPIGLVHVLLLFFFLHLGVMEMAFFNLISVTAYLICIGLINLKKFLPVYMVIYLEVCLHSFAATAFVGAKYNFMIYTVAIVPAGFYMSFTIMRAMRNRLLISVVITFISAFTYISCTFWDKKIGPIYTVGTDFEVNFVYTANAIITFIMVSVLTMLFVIEMEVSRNKLIHKNKELADLANHDSLTGLLNRRSMLEKISENMRQSNGFSLIMCDIDDFKQVNDTYGHECGDTVLSSISDIIMSKVDSNDYVCRWGGEEILILAYGKDLVHAAEKADEIRKLIESTKIESEGKYVSITVTAGVAEYSDGVCADAVIASADKNLYIGKRNGKNRVIS